MPDYRIRYTTKDGDTCKVWLPAENEDDARDEAMQEYWDIEEITSVEEM